MSYPLDTVAQTMGKVIGGIDAPLASGPEVRVLVLGNAISGDVPHLGIGVGDILFHPQKRRLGRILAFSHIAEFLV